MTIPEPLAAPAAARCAFAPIPHWPRPRAQTPHARRSAVWSADARRRRTVCGGSQMRSDEKSDRKWGQYMTQGDEPQLFTMYRLKQKSQNRCMKTLTCDWTCLSNASRLDSCAERDDSVNGRAKIRQGSRISTVSAKSKSQEYWNSHTFFAIESKYRRYSTTKACEVILRF